MRVEQTTVYGESFVGLMGLATDKYAIVCPGLDETDVLKVPTLKTKIYDTHLVGMFCAGNSNGLLVPYFTPDNELHELQRFAKANGFNVARIDGKYTAIGNLIATNDKRALVSEDILEYKKIQETLDVEVVSGNIASKKEVGTYILATNKGFIAHPDAEKQLKQLEEVFGVKGLLGTVNCGIPFVRSGIIANSFGYITGRKTTGIELQRIDDALGF
ncbi:MAG: translation initiation factor IF-6 [Candidatus Altiarchaeota archaeon]|nr:translation initiation factor IF-6 [Candidatus Altiarchaeota archaeon]